MNTPVAITAEQVVACEIEAGIDAAEDLYAMNRLFEAASSTAGTEGRQEAAESHKLLANACSMMLAPESVNMPFKPMVVLADGRRSAIPEDILQHAVALTDAALRLQDSRLRARICDLGWLLAKPRQINLALGAIDAYRAAPLTWQQWIDGGRGSWTRALTLAMSIGKAAGDRVAELEAALLKALLDSTLADEFFGVQIANLMLTSRIGRTNAPAIAATLVDTAGQALVTGNLHQARTRFQLAAKWLGAISDRTGQASASVQEAETWVKEAALRTTGAGPSFMVAADFYENAIQILRTVPGALRAGLGVSERIDELLKLMADAGQRSVAELQSIRSEGIDISELIEEARQAVGGKPLPEALRQFAGLYGGPEVVALREQVLKNTREFPLSSLFSSQIMSAEGRVVAKAPGMGFGDAAGEEAEIALRHSMVRDFLQTVSLFVQGNVFPAHDVLLFEHRLIVGDFMELARNSPVVPKDHAEIFGRALFAGYDRDWVNCIHLLAPQMEHLVRMQLKAVGAQTTTLSADGIETENGLSTLIVMPEIKQVFRDSLVFEIRSIFCDGFGPNLRNQVAHGLLDDDSSQSVYTVYAWWLAFRLVFASMWNQHRPLSRPGPSPAPI